MKPVARGEPGRVIRPLDDLGDTVGVIGRWSAGAPLCALVSGDSSNGARSRWSILASARDDASVVDFERGSFLDEEFASAAYVARRSSVPFVGGWIGWVGYDVGTDFEPSARDGRKSVMRDGRGWMARVEGALVRDETTGEWFGVGDDDEVDRLLSMIGEASALECSVGEFESVEGRVAYERAVARTVEYICAGDVFQANIAHRLRASFGGSERCAFLRMLDAARPAFGALLEPAKGMSDGRVVCSISPELFLDIDFGERSIVTRPIKGTRPGDTDEGAAGELATSEKDNAELAMIVDLMRNDLSRVCEVGSVRVAQERVVERHGGGGVLHAVATVDGTLRSGVGVREVIGATFPPGSVTGAPKIRAMQIIDELEPFARGAYCGAIGFVSDCGQSRFSVAIRTATIDRERGEIVYPVGAGIVAESDPSSEWEETLTKGEAIRRAFRNEGGR